MEQSRERIIDDLAQLLLGAEAAKTLDKFERVVRQLQESEKELEKDVALKEFRREEAAARILELGQTPSESDELFRELLLSLATVGWQRPPTDKIQTEQLSESLQAAVVNVSVLKATAQDLPVDIEGMDRVLQSLAKSKGELETLAKEAGLREQKRARATLRVQEADKRLAALAALTPMAGSGVAELQRNYESFERQLATRSTALAEVDAALVTLNPDKALSRMMLSAAVGERTEQARVAGQTAEKLAQTLAAFERNQTLAVSLQQRLRSIAQELIQHTLDTEHCPLCQAEYSERELLRRIEDAARGVFAGESDKLRLELQKAQAEHERYTSELRSLQVLEGYRRTDLENTSVSAAMGAVAADRQEMALVRSNRDAALLALQAHQEKGWTFARLRELSAAAGIDESAASLDSLDKLCEDVREEQTAAADDLKTLEIDRKKSDACIAQIAAQYDSTAPSVVDLQRTIGERTRAAEAKRKATVQLGSQISLAASASEVELDARLREAQGIAVRLRTSLAKERQDSEAMSRESKAMEDAAAEVAGLRVKLKRVQGAGTVISDLLSQQSERLLTQQVLRENAARIASTFAKIRVLPAGLRSSVVVPSYAAAVSAARLSR